MIYIIRVKMKNAIFTLKISDKIAGKRPNYQVGKNFDYVEHSSTETT